MDGQTYVRVQADVSMSRQRSRVASGSSVTGSGYIISWTFASGITNHEWTVAAYGKPSYPQIAVTPVEGDITATNEAIEAAFRGQSSFYVATMEEWGCALPAGM